MPPPTDALCQLLTEQHATREDMLATLDVVATALLAGSRLATLAAEDDPDGRQIAHAEWHAVEKFAAAIDQILRAARYALPPDLWQHL